MPSITLARVNDTQSGSRNRLVFGLGAEEYAIDNALVQELRAYDHVTGLAGAPRWLLGVVALRGNFVPLVDLRLRYGQSDPRYDASTVVIFLKAGLRQAGLVVDRVADVVQLDPRYIVPAPRLPSKVLAPPLTGIAMLGDRLLAMVDGNALLCQLDAPINALAA